MSETIEEAAQKRFVETLKIAYPSITHETIIRNWSVIHFKEKRKLFGDVENHPKLGNAKDVITSPIVYINETVGVALTKNTAYILKDKLV